MGKRKRRRERDRETHNKDEFKKDFVVSGVKRQTATHHLVHDHTHSPPVHCPAIVIVLQHLTQVKGHKITEYAGTSIYMYVHVYV